MRFQNALPSSIFDPQSSIFFALSPSLPFALSVFRAYIHLKNALALAARVEVGVDDGRIDVNDRF